MTPGMDSGLRRNDARRSRLRIDFVMLFGFEPWNVSFGALRRKPYAKKT